MSKSLEILKLHWGYTNFRGNQEEIIEAVIQKNNVLAVLPTGGGKSVCFQIPAMLNDGVCIVVSPLLALMKDQVAQLQKKSISAVAIGGNLAYQAIEQILQDAIHGHYKFIYVSPERLNSYLFNKYIQHLHVNLIAIDEAHCISQWGHDFRPAYTKINKLTEALKNVPVIALTASATKKVKEDIVNQLSLKKTKIFTQPLFKPNISYSVIKTDTKINKLVAILNGVKGSSIVYCSNRKQTQKVAAALMEQNIKAVYYHAGLPQVERELIQENWIDNQVRVMVSTNAFGMGIDKPDVRTVIHINVPENLENYYQEAGRAGRDGAKAFAVLLYDNLDILKLEELPQLKFPDLDFVKQVYQNIANYLQIPVGMGEGNFYDFDILQFCINFKYEVLQVVHVLKALEKNGHIIFNESSFNTSKLMLTTDRFTLEQIENTNTSFDTILKALLRTYEGIFDNEVMINEKTIAKICRTSLEKVTTLLLQLHKQRILNYFPSKNTPQIFFNYNRASAPYLSFNTALHEQQKELFKEKTIALLKYTSQNTRCRSTYIQHYFNDDELIKCGICDVCLEQKKQPLSAILFEEIQQQIESLNPPINMTNLFVDLKTYNKKHIWEVIHFLEDKKRIKITKEGILTKL